MPRGQQNAPRILAICAESHPTCAELRVTLQADPAGLKTLLGKMIRTRQLERVKVKGLYRYYLPNEAPVTRYPDIERHADNLRAFQQAAAERYNARRMPT